MIDLIRVSYTCQSTRDQLLRKRQELVFSGHLDTGEVTHYDSHHQHIFEHIYESTPPLVRLTGSLHKYAHGRNDGLFTFNDIKKTVRRFVSEYHVPSQASLHRLEIGINLPFTFPKAVIDAAILYHGRVGERKYRKDYYAIEWHFLDKNGRVNYVVKLYKKGEHLLRFELHIEDLRKIESTGIKVISDLSDEGKLLLALYNLYRSIDELFFVPYDTDNKLPPSLTNLWGGYRADSFWMRMMDRRHKDEKYRLKKKIIDAVHQFDLIDWQSVMKKRFVVEGAKMVGMTECDLRTTFSQLGLHAGTVARPEGNRDRHADKVTLTSPTIPIHEHRVVRNTRCSLGVHISAVSYNSLLPRGPPLSRFSFVEVLVQCRPADTRRRKNVIDGDGACVVQGQRLLYCFCVGLWPAALPATGTGRGQTVHRTFMRQIPFELTHTSKDGEEQLPLWRSGIKPCFLQ